MADWFDEIRSECPRALWSRGVELVRAEAVSAERVDDAEAVLRVTNPDGMLTPTVTLYLDDAAWDCDCPGVDDPCEHVAAAVIALRRAQKEGRELKSPTEAGNGHIRYAFWREDRGLAFSRAIVSGDREEPVDTSLKAIASGRATGPRFLATERDLAVERALAASSMLRGRARVTGASLARLVPALAGCEDVRLDGEPVHVSTEPVVPQGHLVDHYGAFRLYVEPDSRITETLCDGLVLCGDTVQPVRESRLSGRELADLPKGRLYAADRALELVTEVLPELRKRIPVEVHTKRLPRTGKAAPPRVHIDSRREGDALAVRADVVYGDPPSARVEDGRIVHLQGMLPVRDEAAEARLARAIQSELGLPVARELIARDVEAIALAERLRQWEGDTPDGSRAHNEFFAAPALEPRLRSSARDFGVEFEAPGPAARTGARGSRVDPHAVLRAWQAGDSLVALPGGGFAPIPSDWLERFGGPLQSLLEARRDDGSLQAASIPDLARLCAALGEPAPPEYEPLRALLEDFDALPAAELPSDLTATLRGYQRTGVDWLQFLRDAGLGALLADDMGLGKTVQVLCALQGRSLVVAPTSVLHNWAAEIRRFRPGLSTCVFHGPKRQLDPAADVTLTTYAILRLDADRLASTTWDCVALDEAQAIKNPASQAARAAYALDAHWRVALTGTPVENRLEELWSQLHFINPGLLGSRTSFQERYAKPISESDGPSAERDDASNGAADATRAGAAAAELRARLRPFVLRRRKREVAPELPPRTEMVLRCELDADERRVYDAVRAATRRDVVKQLAQGGSVLAALEALLRLRQAACHSDLVPGQHAARSAKVDLLLEELETVVADGHKALVFSQWTGLLDRTEPHLRAACVPFIRLDGSTRDRGAVVESFQADDGPPVLLISLRAGGTGLNLTAADHVFLLDPWWNPAVEDQAADRAHRIGQTRPVMVYRLVASDTVEQGILDLQSRKRALAEAALGEADAAAQLTRDDLLALLE